MVNALITSLLMRATPDEVRLILVDPKRVELADYNGMPHLLVPVITEADRAMAALKWAVGEMEMRYRKFAGATARNITSYNETRADPADRLPYIVIIVDELADLMMREGGTVEDPIVRLAQKARATGIHLVLATQRPSVNVVTGLIKANFPSRIAFAMASQIDSRTILDAPGAEDLIGRGDMLFQPSDLPRPIRLQGVFVADREIRAVDRPLAGGSRAALRPGDHRERRRLHRFGGRPCGRGCRPAPAGCRRRCPGVRSRLGVAAAATPQDRVRPCGADHRPARGARLHRPVRRLERAPGPPARSGQPDGTPGRRRWGRQMTTRDHARPAGGEQDREPIADRRPGFGADALGDRLVGAREGRGIDLLRAERETKIRRTYLAALERGDYAALPGAVYVRGFLRNYAQYLGLDPEEAVAQWHREAPVDVPEPVIVIPRPLVAARKGLVLSSGVVVAAVVTLVALAILAYIGFQLVRFSEPPPLNVRPAADRGDRGGRGRDHVHAPRDDRRRRPRHHRGAGPRPLNLTAGGDGAWLATVDLRRGKNQFDVSAVDPKTGKPAEHPVRLLITVPFSPVVAPDPGGRLTGRWRLLPERRHPGGRPRHRRDHGQRRGGLPGPSARAGPGGIGGAHACGARSDRRDAGR